MRAPLSIKTQTISLAFRLIANFKAVRPSQFLALAINFAALYARVKDILLCFIASKKLLIARFGCLRIGYDITLLRKCLLHERMCGCGTLG